MRGRLQSVRGSGLSKGAVEEMEALDKKELLGMLKFGAGRWEGREGRVVGRARGRGMQKVAEHAQVWG